MLKDDLKTILGDSKPGIVGNAGEGSLSARTASYPAWLPIEAAPKDGTTVMLFSRDNGLDWDVIGYGRYANHGAGIAGWISYGFSDPPGNLGLAHPTHWLPLPSAPAG